MHDFKQFLSTRNAKYPHVNFDDLDNFTQAYVRAALWSTSDHNGDSLESNYGPEHIHPDTLAEMAADCKKFQDDHGHHFNQIKRIPYGETPESMAGHDFWLTRNGHGSGFWDGDWHEPAASHLTTAARNHGDFDLYVGDDGMIHA